MKLSGTKPIPLVSLHQLFDRRERVRARGDPRSRLDELWPAFDVKPYFTSNLQLSYETAFRNSSLQGAYLMLAARALGFDVGPLSGFDNALVDEAFFKGTSLRSNFICMVGHGRPEGLYPRGPRLSYETSVRTL